MAQLESLKGIELQKFLQYALDQQKNINSVTNKINYNENKSSPWTGFIIALAIGAGLIWLFIFSFDEKFGDLTKNGIGGEVDMGIVWVSRIFFGIIAGIALIVAIGFFIDAVKPSGPSKSEIRTQLLARQAALWADSQHLRALPSRYQSDECISAMIGFIQNKRASSFKECANLLEEAQWRARMEANTARAASYAKEAAESIERQEWDNMVQRNIDNAKK